MDVRFQVLTTAIVKFRAFWDITSRSLIGLDRCFRMFTASVIKVCQFTPTELHGAISQKALIFVPPITLPAVWEIGCETPCVYMNVIT
jgi:hypothetical protein